MTRDRCDLICIGASRAKAIRAKLLDEGAALDAAKRAKALSDPTRLTLAEALCEGQELCVCDLSWIAGRSQNLVSHHLGALRTRGLVRSRRWLTEAALSPCTLNDVERVFSEVGLAGAACKPYAILRCGYREVSLCSHGFDHLKIETLTR